MSVTKVYLQDNDPRISYSGSWSQVASFRGASGGEHGDSAHITSQVGASATLRFRGNGIVIFLTVPSASDVPSDLLDVLVTLDGRQFSFTKRAISQPLFGQRALQLDSGLDPNVEHTITVAQRGAGVPLRLDSMEYLVPNDGQAGAAAQPYTPDGTLTPLSGPLPNPPSAPSPTPSPSQPTNPGPTSNSSPAASSSNDTPSSASQPSPTPSLSRAEEDQQSESSQAASSNTRPMITTTDSRGVVITKILPSGRIITSTDSTGGIVLHTEPASADSSSSSGRSSESLGTGTIIAIVLGIVVLLAMFGLVLVLLLRRRRKSRRGKKEMEGHHDGQGSSVNLSPFNTSGPSGTRGEPKASGFQLGGSGYQHGHAGVIMTDEDTASRSDLSPSRASMLPDISPPAYSPSVENLVAPSTRKR